MNILSRKFTSVRTIESDRLYRATKDGEADSFRKMIEGAVFNQFAHEVSKNFKVEVKDEAAAITKFELELYVFTSQELHALIENTKQEGRNEVLATINQLNKDATVEG